MLHSLKSYFSVKIWLLYLNYSLRGPYLREVVFSMLYVCKTETTHVDEASS